MSRTIDILKSENYAETVTDRIRTALDERDRSNPFHLFLSGGSTPKVVYAALADSGIDWAGVHLWWGDERFVPPDHADSNFRMVKEQLLEKVSIPEKQVHGWPILSTPDLAAGTYEDEFRQIFLVEKQPLHFQLLGMGDDGHTASLFPGTPALEEKDRYCVANYVKNKDSTRLTLTYPALALSRRVVFLVKGEGKAQAAFEVLEEGKHPASKVFGRESTEFWLDERAAQKL